MATKTTKKTGRLTRKGQLVPHKPTPAALARQKKLEEAKKAAERRLTEKLQEKFLKFFERDGTVGGACALAKVTRYRVEQWIESDVEFNDKMKRARETVIDRAERELYVRGVKGWTETKTVESPRGITVETVTKKSDAALALYLKGRRGNVFKDRTEVTGANGGPIEHQLVARLRAGRDRVAGLLPERGKPEAVDAEVVGGEDE